MPRLPTRAAVLARLLAVGLLVGLPAGAQATQTGTGRAAPTPTPSATSTPPRATATATLTPVPRPSPSPSPLPSPTATPIPQDAPELRALWVDAFHDGIKTPAQVDALVSWARRANFNALFVQVRRRGDAYFLQSSEPRTEDPDLAPGFDPLQYLIERAHQSPRPLQVHAWLATLAVWNKRDTPPADPTHVFNQHGVDAAPGDQWLQLRDDGRAWTGEGATGTGTYYLDPGNPDAARYTADRYLEVLRNYDVDGIHLDQVRYFEGSNRDRRWGYNPTSVARFNRQLDRDPESQPAPDDPDWIAWRRDQVTALVRRVYLEAKALKPNLAVSAAVVAWGKAPEPPLGWEGTAPYGAVFQDWRYWLQEGLVDYLLPMDYYRESPQQAAWLDGWMAWQQANRGARGVVIGLGGYLNTAEESLAQLQRARALGPLGVALYSYAVPSRETDPATSPSLARERFAAGLRDLFPRPAPVPDLPWLAWPTTGQLLVEVPGREGLEVVVDGPRSVTWRTDGTGLAGAPGLLPGTYRVSVQGHDVDPQPAEIVVEPGRTTALRYALGDAALVP